MPKKFREPYYSRLFTTKVEKENISRSAHINTHTHINTKISQ